MLSVLLPLNEEQDACCKYSDTGTSLVSSRVHNIIMNSWYRTDYITNDNTVLQLYGNYIFLRLRGDHEVINRVVSYNYIPTCIVKVNMHL